MGLLPYAANVASDQYALRLLRSNSVRYKVTQGCVVSLANRVAPEQTAQMRRLVCSYAGDIWLKTHFRMTMLIR
ncbi:hypothetical protein DPMN_088152 [Dreissena polymorpha]|uniref:Uncharacterized protein n=1 Tax=Dreissena polymorpha TaxID=45954 RepID=A0A9D4KVD1_DREPO|nr:hypothetical protein DPMN_088152 [Dreissena polymorpha]